MSQTSDEEKAALKASRAKASSRTDEPNEPQLAFRRLQAKVAEKEEALRVSNVDINTL